MMKMIVKNKLKMSTVIILSLNELTEIDCFESEASLVYIMSSSQPTG